MSLSTIILFVFTLTSASYAHDIHGKASYLANEGVVVESGGKKLMFDPFFHNSFGTYTLVPDKMRKAIFDQQAPYDGITAVFISHAHEDHFDAKDMLKYLTLNAKAHLFAPNQAVTQLKEFESFVSVKDRIHAVSLKKDQKAIQIPFDDMLVEAVRIPHAGWPNRADVENIVFRVGGKKQIRVMHFGDADPNEAHYKIHEQFWQAKRTDVSFVPYWFGLVESGKRLLEKDLNTEKAIGVHVPTNLPRSLQNTQFDFFHEPGESRIITR